jgi:hypothetical protein
MQFDEGREMRTRTVTVVLYCIAVSARIAQYLTKEITRDENVRLQKMVIYCTQLWPYARLRGTTRNRSSVSHGRRAIAVC